MARKESITQEKILEAAFEMAREEGFDSITARKLAAKAGCSTQPIFRVYKNMEELWEAVYEKTVVFFQNFYEFFPDVSQVPFVRMGMAYIAFAGAEGHLFELLFLSKGKTGLHKKTMYELLNGKNGNIVAEVGRAGREGCKDPGGLFMKLWIFIHGIACMTLSGDYDLNREETLQMVTGAYKSFFQA